MDAILRNNKPVELGKLYDAMIQFKFARSRLKKYGYREPEPSQLFDTLRYASKILTEKDSRAYFHFENYIDKHSSINGLVDEQTVDEMYLMVLEHSRDYMDQPSGSADVKALQQRNKEAARTPVDGKKSDRQ